MSNKRDGVRIDSGHTWFSKDDFAKAVKDLEASRRKVKELQAANKELKLENDKMKEVFLKLGFKLEFEHGSKETREGV